MMDSSRLKCLSGNKGPSEGKMSDIVRHDPAHPVKEMKSSRKL